MASKLTKAQLEAKLAELTAGDAAETAPAEAKASTVKIPAWMGTSKTETIGLDATAGKKFYVTVARRDGESDAPVHSAKANAGKGGPAKARRFDPATLAFILDNEKQMRSLIASANKLNA
jgi:hypothetical protein